MSSSPVRHCHAFESPFVAEDLIVEVGVLRAVVSIYLVVSRHYAHCSSFLNCRLERLEINLTHCPFVCDHVHASAVCLLIVQGIMLEAYCCTGILGSLGVFY